MHNQIRDLADDFIRAQLVENPRDLAVDDAIVVNLSPEPMLTGTDHPAIVPAWKSTWLRGGTIRQGQRAALIKVVKAKNLGGCMFRGWIGSAIASKLSARHAAVHRRPQDSVGTVTTDPRVFTNERKLPEAHQQFELKLNSWWSPGDTDCFIHNEHPFPLRCIPRPVPAGCRNSTSATDQRFMGISRHARRLFA